MLVKFIQLTIAAAGLALFAPATTAGAPDKSGDVYSDAASWNRTVPRKLRTRPAFAFVQARTGLPNVLLIGDSISMSYTEEVRFCLHGLANVFRVPANARSTEYTLPRLDEFLGQTPWQVIVANWGIHDLTYVNEFDKSSAAPGNRQRVEISRYEANLQRIVHRLQETGARILWATTTPVGAKSEKRGFRKNGDVVRYNDVAMRLMAKEKIPTVDLYTITAATLGTIQTDGVHFNTEGRRLMGVAVADAVAPLLSESSSGSSVCTD